MKIDFRPKVGAMILIVVVCLAYVGYGRGEVDGYIDQYWTWSRQKEEGRLTEKADSYNQIASITLTHLFTQYLGLYGELKRFYRDYDLRQSNSIYREDKGCDWSSNIYLFLNNPLYQVRVGNTAYWRTYETTGVKERKNRDNLFFIQFNLIPYDFPSLYFQFNKRSFYDEYGNQSKKTGSDEYFLNSAYSFSISDLRGSYYLTYRTVDTDTPKESIYNTRNKVFSGSFDLNYSRTFLKEFLRPSLSYRLSFTKSDTTYLSRSSVGSIRLIGSGIAANGTTFDPYPYNLSSFFPITDGAYSTATSINLKDPYRNVGIAFSQPQRVGKIILYVMTNDNNAALKLSVGSLWKVFSTNSMITWVDITGNVIAINTTLYDPLNRVYAVEFLFGIPVEASYFKVVNINYVDPIGDYFVTEIEAYSDIRFGARRATMENSNIDEEINFFLSHKITDKFSLEEGISSRRSSSGDFSPFTKLGEVFSSITGDLERRKQDEPFIRVSRNYYVSGKYNFYNSLFTYFRLSRSENLSNIGDKYSTNSYGVGLNWSPLPRLFLAFTLDRFDNYSKDNKTSTTTTGVFSVNTQLYRQLQLNSQIAASVNKVYTNNETSYNYMWTTYISAPITRQLYMNANFGLQRLQTDKENGSSSTFTVTRTNFSLSYRPGAAVNINYSFDWSKEEEKRTFSQLLSLSWRVYPRVTFTGGLSWYDSKNPDSKFLSGNVNIFWLLRDFLDLRFNYNFNIYKEIKERRGDFISLWISLRF
ncbi:MAG: hypothetical protein ACPLSJ_00605 [Thermosulfidibacteraceae bacterium]|jgi:hypothetical protein